MRLALLVGANPSTFKDSPNVRIPPGSWVVVLSGVTDSQLSLIYNGSRISLHKTTCLDFENPQNAKIDFDIRGSENYVSVFADSIKRV